MSIIFNSTSWQNIIILFEFLVIFFLDEKFYKIHIYQHGDYPTIDHKISVHYGFINNINPEEISSLENLCLTKRRINSKKNSKIDFIL